MGDTPPWWPKTETSAASFRSPSRIAESTYCSTPTPAHNPHPEKVDPKKIQTEIRKHYAELRGCYEALLARHPTAAGKVLTRFIITPEGELTRACIQRDTTLDDDGTAKCMLQAFERI